MEIFRKLFKGQTYYIIECLRDNDKFFSKIYCDNGLILSITNKDDFNNLTEITGLDNLIDKSYNLSFKNNIDLVFENDSKIVFSCDRNSNERLLKCSILENGNVQTNELSVPLSKLELFKLKYPAAKHACIGGFKNYSHPFDNLDYVYTNDCFIETMPMYLHINYSQDKEDELKQLIKDNNLNWCNH